MHRAATDLGTFVKIARHMVRVDSLEAAVRQFQSYWVDTQRATGRNIKSAAFVVDGMEVYTIRPNGNVFAGDDVVARFPMAVA